MKVTWRMWWQYSATPWLSNQYDKLCQFLVWRVMPHRLLNWAAVRVAAHATQTPEHANQHPDTVSVVQMLGAWERAAS